MEHTGEVEVRDEDRGVRSLKGMPGEWRLFAVNP
jgi:hypothetical protein